MSESNNDYLLNYNNESNNMEISGGALSTNQKIMVFAGMVVALILVYILLAWYYKWWPFATTTTTTSGGYRGNYGYGGQPDLYSSNTKFVSLLDNTGKVGQSTIQNVAERQLQNQLVGGVVNDYSYQFVLNQPTDSSGLLLNPQTYKFEQLYLLSGQLATSGSRYTFKPTDRPVKKENGQIVAVSQTGGND